MNGSHYRSSFHTKSHEDHHHHDSTAFIVLNEIFSLAPLRHSKTTVPTLSYIITSANVRSWGDTHENCVGQYCYSISPLHWISLRKGQPTINSIFLPCLCGRYLKGLRSAYSARGKGPLERESPGSPLSARFLNMHLNARSCAKCDWTTAIPTLFKNYSIQDYASRAHQIRATRASKALQISLISPHSESPDSENRSKAHWLMLFSEMHHTQENNKHTHTEGQILHQSTSN